MTSLLFMTRVFQPIFSISNQVVHEWLIEVDVVLLLLKSKKEKYLIEENSSELRSPHCGRIILFIFPIHTFPIFFSRLLVRQSGKLLHVVSRLQFVDSPEWFGVVADDLFQVKNYQKNLNLLFMKNVSSNARIWRIKHGYEYWISTKQ